jgi:hypothetical protein
MWDYLKLNLFIRGLTINYFTYASKRVNEKLASWIIAGGFVNISKVIKSKVSISKVSVSKVTISKVSISKVISSHYNKSQYKYSNGVSKLSDYQTNCHHYK